MQEEAFELWSEWAQVYPKYSSSRALLEYVADTYYLTNIVHNDFQDENGIWRLFDLEVDGEMSRRLRKSPII